MDEIKGRKIVVPEEMLKAALCRFWATDKNDRDITLDRLRAALIWLSDNPIGPKIDDVANMMTMCPSPKGSGYDIAWYVKEWQRRMFLEPESETMMPTPLSKPECRQELFSNKFGMVKAIVCSCGFATTYSALCNGADAAGMKHFICLHEAFLRGPERFRIDAEL